MLTTLTHFVVCKGDGCPWVGSDAYVRAVRSGLEQKRVWAKTWNKMIPCAPQKHETSPLDMAIRRRFQGWMALSVVVDLEASRALAPLLLWDGCQRKECKYHYEKEGSILFKCSKCKVASYCSKDCQRQDWVDFHWAACEMMATSQMSTVPE